MKDNRKQLLDDLEWFVRQGVQLDGLFSDSDELRLKLDGLERVIQLLRLRSGWVEDRISIQEFADAVIAVQGASSGAPFIRVRVGRNFPVRAGRAAGAERTQAELQEPLLLYLLHSQAGGRISNLLVQFLNLIRPHLTPRDAETTKTGVTRAMTTTRAAARTLRLHGLLTHSQRTAYKTWELSILGLLVAALIHEQRPTLEMGGRAYAAVSSGGRQGVSDLLAAPVAAIVSRLQDPDVVADAFNRLCRPDADVFESLDHVVEIISKFCVMLEVQRTSRSLSKTELSQLAAYAVEAVEDAVPPSQLASDLSKSFALREILSPQ